MDIFTANPSSFKMDKNSSFASKLKASISEKLHHFLVNYTDDVLAEYIVVLVCNGKDQNQARDDLEAFLGERSGEFVSWLWDLILKSVDHTHIPMAPSYLNDVSVRGGNIVVKNKHKLDMSKGLHDAKGDTDLLSNNERGYCPSTFGLQPVSSTHNEVWQGSPCHSPIFDNSLNAISDTEGKTQMFRHIISDKSGPTENKSSEVSIYRPSRMQVHSRSSSDDEENRLYVHRHKMVSNHSNGLPPRQRYLPKKELGPSNLQSVTRVTSVAGRRFPPRSVDSVARENARPRGSVWDRLGRPCNDNITVRGKNAESHGSDVVRRTITEDPLKAHNKQMPSCVPSGKLDGGLTGKIIASGSSSGTVISNASADEYRRSYRDPSVVYLPQHVDKSNKKRQFSKIGDEPANCSVSLGESKYRHLQDKRTFNEFQRPSSTKYSRSESLNIISPGTRQAERSGICQAFELPDTAFFTSSSTASQRKLGEESLESTHTLVSNGSLTKSGPANIDDVTKTNLKPVQAQMLDVKLRLHQMEKEMSKLKAKQLEGNEGKVDFLASSGALSHSDDDVESRTVYVTNVHFAAPKDALSSHFAKCGAIAKVIIVNDVVTAQPKGTAYITFDHTESADKAIALSGTSFWSRTLKVVKKAEMPVVAPVSIHSAGNPGRPLPVQVNRKVTFQRPYASSLQWRRGQPVPTENSIATHGYGLEASGTLGHDHSLVNTNTAEVMESHEEALEEEKCKEAPVEVEECKGTCAEEEF